MKSLINIEFLTKKQITNLVELAKNFKLSDGAFVQESIYPDKTVGALFFEPSTRTKLSFEIAALNLGARFIDFDCSQSSLKKGESIKDTIETISLMGVDTLIIRSKEELFEDLINDLPNINFINAGQGILSHPSQVLTDYMTMNEFSKSPDNLDILVVGDLDHSRVANSFLELLKITGSKRIRLSGIPELCTKYMDHQQFEYFDNLSEAISNVDLIMALRIQNERLENTLSINHKDYVKSYQITLDNLQLAKKDFLLFHPGPVNWGIELEKDVEFLSNTKIKSQVTNGVAMRMAILSSIFSE